MDEHRPSKLSLFGCYLLSRKTAALVFVSVEFAPAGSRGAFNVPEVFKSFLLILRAYTRFVQTTSLKVFE